jgi:hypothetical protein
MTNPLKSEESFTKFVNGLCCNGCKFLVNDVCTEKDAKLHDVDRSWLVQDAINQSLHATNDEAKIYHKEFADNINNYYLCEEFISRKQ